MIYFKEPKLHLTAFGEFFFNLLSYCFYLILSVLTVAFLLNDTQKLKWLGFLFLLFIISRIINTNQGDKGISEVEKYIENKKEFNVAQTLTPKAYKIVSKSMRKSLALNKDFQITLLEKLLKERDVKETLKRLGIDENSLLSKIEESELEITNNKNELIGVISELIKESFVVALETGESFIEPRNILVAIAKSPEKEVKKIFELFNMNPSDLDDAIIFGRYKNTFSKIKKMPTVLGGFAYQRKRSDKRIMNRAWTARPTPFLDKFSKDLTSMARKERIGLLVGHKKEFDQLINTLSRALKPNVLLVGDPGIGKSTMIHHLAFRIIRDKVPTELFDKRLISLEISSLIANAGAEQVAERLKRIVEEVETASNIILFIPNCHDLFKSIEGNDKSINAIDILLPLIRNSSTPIIGETYPREHKQYIERRTDFMEQFEIVRAEEISNDEAVRILTYQSIIFENQFKIFITLRSIKKAVFLAKRYLHQKPMPSGAIDLIKQSLSKVKNSGGKILDEDTVIMIAQELSNVPIQQAEGEELDRLLNLEELIHKRLINQVSAVKSVSQALREYRSGLSNQGGPLAVFLFIGPTGVGKTELAKILTKIEFNDKDAMVRFDMSEYQNKESVSRFIGSPNGERSGSLTDAILEKPYSVVLLDEFEKAHPDILNLFLQVFDDGRLTDSIGRTVNFENTIIIATSNAHSTFIKESIESGKEVSEISEIIKNKLTDYFKPELINRFSDIIVFRSLKIDEIERIAEILIKETIDQLKNSHGVELIIDKSAIQEIAKLGYSPAFGARPLKKVISDKIKSRLANKILKKEIDRGNVLTISHSEEGFNFKIVE